MSATLIAKVPTVEGNANWIFCKADDEPGVYLAKCEYLDDNGKVFGTSVKWHRISKSMLVDLLGYCDITLQQADEILTA